MTADYWWLTMSSLWMANADNRQAVKNGHYSALRLFVREAGIFISLGLAIIFLSYNQWTLDRHWDWLRSGKCFRTLDRSAYGSGWIWIAGLCLNELTCGAAMLSQKVYTAVSSDAKHRKIEGFLIRRVRHYASQASEDAIRFAKHFYVRDVLSFFTNVVAAHATALAVFICFCLRQAWSFWVSGNGTPATTAIFFLAFFLWNFADLVTIKVMNAPLLQPGGSSEDLGTWGFGQVLPMALIASVGFMAVDAYDTVF